MAVKKIAFSDLRLGEKVTLKLRDGESVIVGKVTQLPTAGGNAKVTLINNKNSVVVTPSTNFRIYADRGPTVGDTLGGYAIGTVFTFVNRFGAKKTWVKTGADRVTLVDNTRPAHSLSISGGFPVTEEAGNRIARSY